MDIRFHEPGEGFEIDEGDWGARRRVGEDGLDTASFLAIASDRPGGVQGWGGVGIERLRTDV